MTLGHLYPCLLECPLGPWIDLSPSLVLHFCPRSEHTPPTVAPLEAQPAQSNLPCTQALCTQPQTTGFFHLQDLVKPRVPGFHAPTLCWAWLSFSLSPQVHLPREAAFRFSDSRCSPRLPLPGDILS